LSWSRTRCHGEPRVPIGHRTKRQPRLIQLCCNANRLASLLTPVQKIMSETAHWCRGNIRISLTVVVRVEAIRWQVSQSLSDEDVMQGWIELQPSFKCCTEFAAPSRPAATRYVPASKRSLSSNNLQSAAKPPSLQFFCLKLDMTSSNFDNSVFDILFNPSGYEASEVRMNPRKD
jgi:hypothetical protein